MRLSNKVYDILKWLCMVALNAFGTAYRALSGVWSLPFGEEVQQTCAIISVLLGALLGIASANYYNENDIVIMEKDINSDEQ